MLLGVYECVVGSVWICVFDVVYVCFVMCLLWFPMRGVRLFLFFLI